MAIAVPFPDRLPPGYRWYDDEPVFEPARHLQLEPPASVVSLLDLGYEPDELVGLPTDAAISAPFRILSDEGAAVMLDVARRLRETVTPAGDRIERAARGGCYRSRWLRDLCLAPEVSELLSEVYGTPVAPHPMVSHLGHLNYEPLEQGRAVDRWHHDTLPLDYVMTVTDPATVEGGRFEYFVGTKAEAASLGARGETPPEDRRVAPDLPGPGWAVALHGNMVVHRGGPLERPAERITMVNGYVPLDTSLEAQSRTRDLIGVDDEAFLYGDWARFAAWRSRDRLAAIVDGLEHGMGRDEVIARLESAVADVTGAIADMRAGETVGAHYERSDVDADRVAADG